MSEFHSNFVGSVSATKSKKRNEYIKEWQALAVEFDSLADNSTHLLKNTNNILDLVERIVSPMQTGTSSLQIIINNTNEILGKMDEILEYQSVVTKYNLVINEGCTNKPINTYIEALNACIAAKNYFRDYLPSSSDCALLVSLFNNGTNSLKKELVEKVLAASNLNFRVKNKSLIDYIMSTSQYIDVFEKKYPVYTCHTQIDIPEFTFITQPLFPDDLFNTVKIIQEFLVKNEQVHPEFHNNYVEVRSKFLELLITKIKNECREKYMTAKNNSRNIHQTVNPSGSSLSPFMSPSMNGNLVKNASTASLTNLAALNNTSSMTGTLKKRNNEKASTQDTINNPADIMLPELGEYFYFMRMLNACFTIATMEKLVVTEIIADEFQNLVISKLLMAMLRVVSDEADMIANRCSDLLVFCSSGVGNLLYITNCVVSLMPLLNYFYHLRNKVSILSKVSFIEPRRKLTDIVNIIETLVKSILLKYRRFLKTPTTSNESVAASAHVDQISTNTLTILQELIKHSAILGYVCHTKILDNISGEKLVATHNTLYEPEKSYEYQLSFRNFAKSVILNLQSYITIKGNVYTDKTTKNIFLINNYSYAINKLTQILADEEKRMNSINSTFDLSVPSNQPSLSAVLLSCSSDMTTSLNILKKEFIGFWSGCFTIIKEFNDMGIVKNVLDSQYFGKNLSKKDKHVIKSTFKSFNTEFNNLASRIILLDAPDRPIQNDLISQLEESVGKIYQQFFNSFSDVPFTKKPAKYLKNTPDNLKEVIRNLFNKNYSFNSTTFNSPLPGSSSTITSTGAKGQPHGSNNQNSTSTSSKESSVHAPSRIPGAKGSKRSNK